LDETKSEAPIDGSSEFVDFQFFDEQSSDSQKTKVTLPLITRTDLYKIKNYFDESVMLKYRLSAFNTLVQTIKYKENTDNISKAISSPDLQRMNKAAQIYENLEPIFTKNSPLNLIEKITVIARHFERRAHRVAQGDGDEYTSAISHTKFLINQIIEGVGLPNTKSYQTLAVVTTDRGGLLDGKREPGVVIPAHYVWAYEKPVINSLELLLIGRKRKSLVSQADTAGLEQAFRDGKLEHKVITLDRIGKVNASEQPFTRALHLFGNELVVPGQWEKNQTNLFCSLYVDPSPNYYIYHNLLKQFQTSMEHFKILYVKQLQHALNLWQYNLRKDMQKSRGSAENEKFLFYGSGPIVPRTIVLGSAMDFWRSESKKKGKFFTSGIEFSSEPWYADQFAYLCKNLQPGQSVGRKQMLVCYVSLGNSSRKDSPVASDFLTNDSIYTIVESQHGQTSTVYAVSNPLHIYPILLIEYEPLDNTNFSFETSQPKNS